MSTTSSGFVIPDHVVRERKEILKEIIQPGHSDAALERWFTGLFVPYLKSRTIDRLLVIRMVFKLGSDKPGVVFPAVEV